MNINPYKFGLTVRTRPMCWLAIGFLLTISVFLLGRSYEDVLPFLETGEVILEGTIENKQYKASAYGDYWQIILKNVKALHYGNMEGKYLCQISSAEDTEFKIGQTVLLEGNYTIWEEPTNPGQFNSGKYYCSQGILGQFKKCKVIKTGKSFSAFRENLWAVRQKAGTFLEQELGKDDGAVISAMLLGEKSGLDEEQKSLYQRNGISHILAISGLHLTLLGMGVFRILKVILASNRQASVVVIIIMSLYCVFTGNSISTIRATIMFVLSLIAGILGRSYDSLSALGLAAILQLFMNPYVLNNSGFLLSFLAVIGVTFIAPKLQELYGVKRKFTKSLCVSLSATIATLPVLLWNYGTYPWYSVFLNLLILPPMSVLLFLAVILVGLCLMKQSALTGMGIEWIGIIHEGTLGGKTGIIEGIVKVSAWGMKGILEYFEVCCRIFEQIMFQDGYIGSPTVLQIILYACLVALAISGILRHSDLGRKMLLLSAISILTLNLEFGTEVTMLDVGQGDSVVICNDNENIYISDCGSSSVGQVGKYRLIPFLKHKGYGKIKGIFISHLDEDHINGIVELLEMAPTERIKVEYLFLSESVCEMEEDKEILEKIQNLAKQCGSKLVYLAQGDKISDGNMEFLCLYPKAEERVTAIKGKEGIRGTVEKSKEYTGKNRNNQSLVLLMQYKDFDMLLTGDVEKAGEMEIIEYIDRMSSTNILNDTNQERLGVDILAVNGEIDVLKVAHHGSSSSGCEEFLELVKPELSLISCGKNNSYGHPHEETLERLDAVGSKIMSTVDSGAITLKIGRRIKVYEYRNEVVGKFAWKKFEECSRQN